MRAGGAGEYECEGPTIPSPHIVHSAWQLMCLSLLQGYREVNNHKPVGISGTVWYRHGFCEIPVPYRYSVRRYGYRLEFSDPQVTHAEPY